MNTLLRKKAPDFTAPTIIAQKIEQNFNLYDYIDGCNCVLFFYPLDFTFVCPSEILAHQNRVQEFERRNTKLIGISVDSHFTHLAWINTPLEKGGIGAIDFPLVSDLTKFIARNYRVLIDDNIAVRATFIIDQSKTIRHITANDLSIGRNVDETLRTLDAMIHADKHGEVCPAGWHPGSKAMKPSQEGVASYLAENAKKL